MISSYIFFVQIHISYSISICQSFFCYPRKKEKLHYVHKTLENCMKNASFVHTRFLLSIVLFARDLQKEILSFSTKVSYFSPSQKMKKKPHKQIFKMLLHVEQNGSNEILNH